MERAALARRLQERGAELGLGAVGIASIEPSEHAEFLEQWLAHGYAGAMAWMERTAAVRVDLRQRFPWARSAVVVAVSYLPYRGDRRAQPGLLPFVSRYAVGRDYHDVLRERLEILAAFLVAEATAETRVYVDTGPVLERELAARAGLGWVGKSTNLIRPGGDSWVLLGEILTDLDLPAGGPVPDRCGTCTACLDACPTHAFPAPYVLDATRCISYLTIELRGQVVPRDRRTGVGDWVFGCDVCQEVCPWNHRVPSVADAPFLPSREMEESDLAGLVRLDATGFQERFRPTPLERPRRAGLVRNALTVAANTGDEPAVDAARDLLRDEEPVVRATAAWALGRAGGPGRRPDLERARDAETDPEVRGEMTAALEEGDPP